MGENGLKPICFHDKKDQNGVLIKNNVQLNDLVINIEENAAVCNWT